MTKHSNSIKDKGFTLIEVVAVIVILSVVAVLSVGYVSTFAKSTVSVNESSRLVSESQLTLTRLKKELRNALPNSFRISNGDRCVSFLPVVANGFYQNELADQVNGLAPISSIPVAPYQINAGRPLFMSVNAASVSELYGNNPASLVEIQSFNPTVLTLSDQHRWQQNSARETFFIVDNANAFCLINNELRYYSNFSPRLSRVNLTWPYDLLASSVESSGRAFTLIGGHCLSCLDISLTFSASDRQLPVVATIASRYSP